LLRLGLFYLLFTHVVRFGKQIEHCPLKLLSAIVLWSYFAEATGQSLQSLVQRENLLRRVRFPAAAIPLSVALTSAFNLVLNVCLVVCFLAISGISPTPSWLDLLPLLVSLFVITASASILLSVLYVPFRDMAPIWEVATQMLFWGTPIIYVIETAPESVRKLLMMNPIAVIIEQARHAVVDPSAPSAAASSGGAVRLLIPFGLTAALLAISLALYRRAEPTIAERL